MSETEIAKKILGLIAEARQYSNPYNANELFRISEELMGLLVYLIKPLMDAETEYRLEMAEMVKNDISASSAEMQAKSGNKYAKYRNLERVYKLAEEQIKLTKKFAGLLSDELKRI